MQFGETKVVDAAGAILAHTIKDNTITLKKGRRLTEDDCQTLSQAGIQFVTVAKLEDGDVHEDSAAAQIAKSTCGDNAKLTEAFTGRCNITAECAGLVQVDQEFMHGLNEIHESVTVATLPDLARVSGGQVIATIKIIPFAIDATTMTKVTQYCKSHSAAVCIRPFQKRSVAIINTVSPTLKRSVIDKTTALTRQRVQSVGGSVQAVLECDHTTDAVANALNQCLEDGPDTITIVGASVTVDRADVVPSGIQQAGGDIVHFGMPVDPGNLVLIAKHQATQVMVLPGCARSPKLNGIDWILERYAAGLDVTPSDIMALGVGGLLIDSPQRPLPRDQAVRKDVSVTTQPKIAALIMAAGQSRRMGGVNKLLEDVDGEPLVRKTARAALESAVGHVVVVTGHQQGTVEQALDGLPINLIHNPDFAKGLSTSLRCGLNALPDAAAGAIVCLGDMPSITARHLDALIEDFDPEAGSAIGVPVHQGKRGNPVLFARRFFAAMAAVKGDVGARHLIGDHEDLVYEVEFGDTAVLTDLDTPEAWSQYRAEQKA